MLGAVLTTAAAAVAASAAGYQSMAPTGQWFGRTFTGLSRPSKQLALTYDDGPNDPHTLRLLDVDENSTRRQAAEYRLARLDRKLESRAAQPALLF